MERWGWMAVSLLVLACGPSGKQMQRAKSAQYTCTGEQVFTATVEAVEETAPPVGQKDPARGVVMSELRWHGKNGERKTEGSSRITTEDVKFAVIAAVRKTDAGFSVVVEPKVIGQRAGNIQGEELSRQDANWPPFADAKVDAIHYGIYERLQRCATTKK